MGIDPIHRDVLTVFAVKIGGVVPRAGLNLFAVSSITDVPAIKVMLDTVRSFARTVSS
ncbi:MAG: TRAP-type C4-dicarboxylate transport system permease large subunit [Gammaproteobacteria bacterium]|jgi:TRAP-type C4-dicarboxylate transport system permease large subunit